jgi:hypothetical protein
VHDPGRAQLRRAGLQFREPVNGCPARYPARWPGP